MYGVPSGMHPGMTASLESLHPFFPQARMPEAPLSEDDLAFFMLLVTYSDPWMPCRLKQPGVSQTYEN